MVPPENPSQPNSIEVYLNGEFEEPARRIQARFPVKGKKKDPQTFIDGRFDGFEICPLNPACADPAQSP